MEKIALDERQVQTWALHYLHSKYNCDFPNKPSFADAEMELESVKRGPRADGLICFKRNENDFFTISLEAKSIKTINDLFRFIEKGDNELSHKQQIFISLLLIAPLSIVLWLFLSISWYWLVSIGVFTLFLSLLGIGIYSKQSSFFKASVHDQLSNYPGNEKWIAISEDAWEQIENDQKKKRFIKICKDYKFGLLKVNLNSFVVEVCKSGQIQGQFLEMYFNSDSVKKILNISQGQKFSYKTCMQFLIKGKIEKIICGNPLSEIKIADLEVPSLTINN